MPDDIPSRTKESIKIIEDDKSIIDVQKLINGKWVSNETDRGISLSNMEIIWEGEKLYLKNPEITNFVTFHNLCKITPSFTQELLDNIYAVVHELAESYTYNQILLISILPQLCYEFSEAINALGFTSSQLDPKQINIDNYILATPFKFNIQNVDNEWYATYFREFLSEHGVDSSSEYINAYDFIVVPKDITKTNPIESIIPIVILLMHLFADAGILAFVDEKHDIYVTRFETGD